MLLRFLTETLDFHEGVEDAYIIGTKEPCPVAITFYTAKDKAKVFEVKKRLKSLDRDHPVYLNHYLSAGQSIHGIFNQHGGYAAD